MSARLMGAVIGLAVAAVWVSTARAGTVPGQLLVQLKPNLTLTERSPGLVPVVRSVRLVGRSGLALVEVDPRQADAAAAQLRRDRRIARVQPNYVYRALFTPNDPSFGYQWNFQKVEAAAAWDFDASAPLYGGDPAVVVAVLDSGVAFEDYQSYVRAPDFSSTAFVAGTDVVNDDSHPNDDHGHGTHVTGTVAQSTNNGV
ncbi:MAG: S8 family serine peptidase, partial [Candidatus Kerfeldbacteria bacterium]|nr:S8 family serine peptidase [Candidatus Kerfeldbacteria bacterium]